MKQFLAYALLSSVLSLLIFLPLEPAIGNSMMANAIVPPPSTTPIRSISMPLLPSVDNCHVFVYIKINGHSALPFLLDTGSDSALLVDEWAREELNINKTAEASVVEPGHTKYFYGDVQSAEIVTADAGQPLISTNLSSALCGHIGNLPLLKNGDRCAGVLGMPFFENGVFTLDYSASNLIFYPDGVPPTPTQTFVTLPLIQPDTAQSLYFAHLEINGQSCDYVLDTGAVISSLPKPLLPNFLSAHPQAATFLTMRQDLSQTLLTDCVLVKDFRLRTLHIPYAYFAITEAQAFPPYPVLGMDIVKHFTATINVKNKTLTLIANGVAPGDSPWQQSGGNKEFLDRAVGFMIRPQKNKRLVSKLIKGSPAERGGVQEDDEIVTLNGKPLPDKLVKNLKDAASIITAPTDSMMSLTLLRGGKLLAKQIAISNDLDKTTYLPLGIRFLSIDQQDFLIVSAVLSGSLADKAGLKVGDLVEGVDDITFRAKSWAAIQSLLTPVPSKRLVLEIGQRQEAEFPKMRWTKTHLVINK